MAPLTGVLTGLIGALAAVVAYFWPQLMTCAREHLLPWIDEHTPDLAPAVRLAFHDLDPVGVGWHRTVRTAWRRLRDVLVHETATFVQEPNGDWVVRISSSIRDLAGGEKPVVTIVTEQCFDGQDLPDDVRAQALSDGLDGTSVDILRIRDQLLADVA
jgi:hypothetical protein